MIVGKIDFDKKLGLWKWKNFKKFFDEHEYSKNAKATAEEVYIKLGGKPPKSETKKVEKETSK